MSDCGRQALYGLVEFEAESEGFDGSREISTAGGGSGGEVARKQVEFFAKVQLDKRRRKARDRQIVRFSKGQAFQVVGKVLQWLIEVAKED